MFRSYENPDSIPAPGPTNRTPSLPAGAWFGQTPGDNAIYVYGPFGKWGVPSWDAYVSLGGNSPATPHFITAGYRDSMPNVSSMAAVVKPAVVPTLMVSTQQPNPFTISIPRTSTIYTPPVSVNTGWTPVPSGLSTATTPEPRTVVQIETGSQPVTPGTLSVSEPIVKAVAPTPAVPIATPIDTTAGPMIIVPRTSEPATRTAQIEPATPVSVSADPAPTGSTTGMPVPTTWVPPMAVPGWKVPPKDDVGGEYPVGVTTSQLQPAPAGGGIGLPVVAGVAGFFVGGPLGAAAGAVVGGLLTKKG